MKCTNNRVYRKRRNRKRELRIRISLFFVTLIAVFGGIFLLAYIGKTSSAFIPRRYQTSVHQTPLFSEQLCITNEDVEFDDFYRHDEFNGALLFDINTQEVLYSEHVHEQLYPASTTKIMTAYLALKYGDLDSFVKVSKNATNIPSDSSSAHLKTGDRVQLIDLLYALMLPSGNDSAIAIAEHISGTEEKFVKLMNKEAKLLGATNTHFVNSHGYQDKKHYTTAYDLYLIFNECLKNETFIEIISAKEYSATVTESNGNPRDVIWNQSNQFVNGQRNIPQDVTVIGGKTGTTLDAGACILLYCKNDNNNPFIAIMMGASSRRNLYDNMTFLLRAIPNE